MQNHNSLKHVIYEIEMLSESYEKYWIDEKNLKEKEVWKHNFILEASLMRIRLLYEFFGYLDNESKSSKNRNARDDDILASSYGYKSTNKPIPGLKNQIHKRILHLTSKRDEVAPSDKEWEFCKYIKSLNNEAVGFIKQILSEEDKSIGKEEIRQLEELKVKLSRQL